MRIKWSSIRRASLCTAVTCWTSYARMTFERHTVVNLQRERHTIEHSPDAFNNSPPMHIRNGVSARRSAYDRSFYAFGVIRNSVGMRRRTGVRIHESSRIINGDKRDGGHCGSSSPCVAAFE